MTAVVDLETMAGSPPLQSRGRMVQPWRCSALAEGAFQPAGAGGRMVHPGGAVHRRGGGGFAPWRCSALADGAFPPELGAAASVQFGSTQLCAGNVLGHALYATHAKSVLVFMI